MRAMQVTGYGQPLEMAEIVQPVTLEELFVGLVD